MSDAQLPVLRTHPALCACVSACAQGGRGMVGAAGMAAGAAGMMAPGMVQPAMAAQQAMMQQRMLMMQQAMMQRQMVMQQMMMKKQLETAKAALQQTQEQLRAAQEAKEAEEAKKRAEEEAAAAREKARKVGVRVCAKGAMQRPASCALWGGAGPCCQCCWLGLPEVLSAWLWAASAAVLLLAAWSTAGGPTAPSPSCLSCL